MAVIDKIDNNRGFFTRRYYRHVSLIFLRGSCLCMGGGCLVTVSSFQFHIII